MRWCPNHFRPQLQVLSLMPSSPARRARPAHFTLVFPNGDDSTDWWGCCGVRTGRDVIADLELGLLDSQKIEVSPATRSLTIMPGHPIPRCAVVPFKPRDSANLQLSPLGANSVAHLELDLVLDLVVIGRVNIGRSCDLLCCCRAAGGADGFRDLERIEGGGEVVDRLGISGGEVAREGKTR